MEVPLNNKLHYMNWHFNFFLLDVVAWIAIAVLLCNRAFIIKSKVNLNLLTKLNIITITLFVGFLSVLVNGIPNTAFSIDSFAYVFITSFTLVTLKTKRKYLPKASKKYTKVAYI